MLKEDPKAGKFISGDVLKIIPDATLYDFGIIMSRVHIAGCEGEECGDFFFATLYNDDVMPVELRRAHEGNGVAVYGGV